MWILLLSILEVNSLKAAVLKTNKKIVIEEIPISDPNPNECQIAIKAAGVCSSDIQRSFKKEPTVTPSLWVMSSLGKWLN